MRAGFLGGLGLIVLAAIALVFFFSMYVVDPTQQALVLRFGQTIRVVTEEGLYFRTPLVDNVVYIEKRILDLDSQPLEVIAADQKRLVVDAFARYKVVDPLLFYQAVGNIAIAETRLSPILDSAVRRSLGEVSFEAVVSVERPALMLRITEQVNSQAQQLGIDVVDVKIRRVDLPAANSAAVYQLMQTARQEEAAAIRSQGAQIARGITAIADRDSTVIVAVATGQAEQTRGAGDAQVNRIFAEAFGRDEEFFAFYRSLEAYRNSFSGGTTQLVISPTSDFFRYLDSPNGGLDPSQIRPATPPSPDGAPALPPIEIPPAPALDLPEGLIVPAPALELPNPEAPPPIPEPQMPVDPAPAPVEPAPAPAPAAPAPAPAAPAPAPP